MSGRHRLWDVGVWTRAGCTLGNLFGAEVEKMGPHPPVPPPEPIISTPRPEPTKGAPAPRSVSVDELDFRFGVRMRRFSFLGESQLKRIRDPWGPLEHWESYDQEP